MDGDYVAPQPKLLVRLPKQESGHGIRRTEFFVDNRPFVSGTPVLDDQKAIAESGDELTFAPSLSNGQHELKVRVVDVTSLGGLDTLEQSVTVNSRDVMSVIRLYNYPNPFATSTYFTFILTGQSPPEELSIRIFTIAGRRIRELVLSQSQLQRGFNRVFWDGRDSDGDELANGYYFYQLTVKGEGKMETSVEKLAKIR